MADHAVVVRVTRMRPAEGREQELRDFTEKFAAAAREEPGCFGAQVCTIQEEPGWLAAISRWSDQSALNAAIPKGDDYRQRLAELLAAPAETRHYTAA